MKLIKIILSAFLSLFIFTGCGYLKDRRNDFADIFTGTIEKGLGGYAHIGPISSGLFSGHDLTGIRGGIFIPPGTMERSTEKWFEHNDGDFYLLFAGFGGFLPMYNAGSNDYQYITAIKEADIRRKTGMEYSFCGASLYHPNQPGFQSHISHYSNIEFAGGLFYGVRFGFNPAELLDFIVGWTTIDLLDDDLSCKKQK